MLGVIGQQCCVRLHTALSPVQTDATLLDVTCCVRFHTLLHVVPQMFLRVVAQSLKPVKVFSQQLPTFLLFCDRRSVAQQCWIRLHGSSNIVGATHAHYAWFTKTYGLYPSHDALQVPTLLRVVASVCKPLPTRTQQLPTLLAQQCLLAALGIRDMISYKQNWTRISRGRVALGLSSVSIGHHVLLSHFVSRLIPEKPLVVG